MFLVYAVVLEGEGDIKHRHLIASEENEFLAKHRRQFDVIVIDSSPILGIADAPLLSRFVDAVVFVVEANRAHYGQVKMAVRRLRDMNANIIGALLTKFRALEVGKDYNYQYQYYAYNEK